MLSLLVLNACVENKHAHSSGLVQVFPCLLVISLEKLGGISSWTIMLFAGLRVSSPFSQVKLKNLVYHNARVTAIAWAPDGQKVATASLDTSIIIYDIAKPPSARYTIENTHVGGVSAITYLAPNLLASAGHDACVRLWNV